MIKKYAISLCVGYLALLSGNALAQNVITLDSIDLGPRTSDIGSTREKADKNQASCLQSPNQANCTSQAAKSTHSFSLNDVVNLGIVDRSEVEVENDQGVVVKVEDRVQPLPSIDLEILFDYNSANLRPDQLAPLYALADELKEVDFKRARIVLMGHTDAIGSAAYNKELSLKRANSVAAFVGQVANIPANRINTSGMGFDFLRFPKQPSHPGNRRVQIILVE